MQRINNFVRTTPIVVAKAYPTIPKIVAARINPLLCSNDNLSPLIVAAKVAAVDAPPIAAFEATSTSSKESFRSEGNIFIDAIEPIPIVKI